MDLLLISIIFSQRQSLAGAVFVYKKEVRTIALTRQQKAFADEYIKTLKIKDSYLKAYKSCKSVDSAYSAGSRLLKNEEVKAYIEERLKILDEEMIADQREVLRRLLKKSIQKNLSRIELWYLFNPNNL